MTYSKNFTLKWADVDDESILNAVMNEVDGDLLILDDFFQEEEVEMETVEREEVVEDETNEHQGDEGERAGEGGDAENLVVGDDDTDDDTDDESINLLLWIMEDDDDDYIGVESNVDSDYYSDNDDEGGFMRTHHINMDTGVCFFCNIEYPQNQLCF